MPHIATTIDHIHGSGKPPEETPHRSSTCTKSPLGVNIISRSRNFPIIATCDLKCCVTGIVTNFPAPASGFLWSACSHFLVFVRHRRVRRARPTRPPDLQRIVL